MKIAILGTRGIPGRYGGFETLAEQLASQLSDRGHDVSVYCRRAFVSESDNFDPRVRRIILPGVKSKYLDTVFHTFLSVLHVIGSDADVCLICNVANSPFAWIPRVFRIPTLLNVDGLDRKRRKWNFIGKAYLYFCELLSLFTPSHLLTDSNHIQHYFRQRYGRDTSMIAYGAEVPASSITAPTFDLPRGKYVLCVSRFEPEYNLDLVIKAYANTRTDWPLVVVGGNPYNPGYERALRTLADPRVIFTGPIYGEGYWELQRNAGLFVLAAEVGGTHPSLVEAMAVGNPVLFLDNPENRETVAGGGVGFRPSPIDLGEKLQGLLDDPQLRKTIATAARRRAADVYSWDMISAQYEQLLYEVAGQSPKAVPLQVVNQEES
jgi:glycosyltransferase involved in cell wall biosynthesis